MNEIFQSSEDASEYQIVGPHPLYAANQCAGAVIAGLVIAAGSILALPAGVLLALGVLAGGLGIVALGVCYGILIKRSTEFQLSEEVLMIKSGIISREADAIRIALVVDIDVHVSLLERVVGAGTLSLRMIEHGQSHIHVPFVLDPFELQSFILRRAAKFRAIGMQGDGCHHGGN